MCVSTKKCQRCNEIKAVSAFSKCSIYGYQSWCKDCQRITNKIYYNHNKKRQKDQQLQRKYNINLKQFRLMLTLQNHQCAICKCKLEENGNTHTDHDHNTGKVRSLLCKRCNQVLGFVQDSPELLLRCVEYLYKHQNI